MSDNNTNTAGTALVLSQNAPSNVAPRRPLGDVAISAAITAVAGSERAFYTAMVSIATFMVAGQADRVTGELAIDKVKNKSAYKAFLKRFALKGHVVWRGSEATLLEALSKVGKVAKETAVALYIDKKEKGSRLTDGLARLQTMATKIADDVCEKHPDVIRELVTIRQSGGDAEAQISRFERHVKETYGDSSAKVQNFFYVAPKPPSQEAPIAKVTASAMALTDVDLATLLESIQAEMLRRKAENDAAAEFTDGEEDETDGEADGTMPVGEMQEAA